MKQIFGPTEKLESDINKSGDKKQNLSVSCLKVEGALSKMHIF